MNATLQSINNYWAVIVFVGSILSQAVWVYFKVTEHETRIEKLEHDTSVNTNSIQEIRQTLQNIDGKLDILVEGYKRK